MTVVEVEAPAERSRICENGLYEHNPCLLMVKRL